MGNDKEFNPTHVGSGTSKEEVQTVNSRIQAFNLFSHVFQPTLNVIYYPGSSTDTRPSNTESFRKSRIIYLDNKQEAIQTLKGEHYEAHLGNAENFNPGEVNLLLLLNFYAEEPLKYVAKNGYVICNNHWTGTLRKMLGQSDFKLVGVFIDGNQRLSTDEETLRTNSQTPNLKRNMKNLFVFRKE